MEIQGLATSGVFFHLFLFSLSQYPFSGKKNVLVVVVVVVVVLAVEVIANISGSGCGVDVIILA